MTGQIAALTLPDPYLISRVLNRQEALSSSSLEGTHSTPNELPVVAENDQNASHPDRTNRLCPQPDLCRRRSAHDPQPPLWEEPVRRSCQSRDRRKTSLQMSVLVTSLGPPDNPMERLKSLFHSDIPAKTAIQPLICHSFGLSDPSGRNGRSVIERQMEHCEAYEP